MPVYVNPSNHPVNICMSSPRVCIFLFPQSWAPSRLPQDGKQEVELDEKLAAEYVKLNMLRAKNAVSSARLRTLTAAAASVTASATLDANGAAPVPTKPADDNSPSVAPQVDASPVTTSTSGLSSIAEAAVVTEPEVASDFKSELATLQDQVALGKITPEEGVVAAARIRPPLVQRPPSPPKRQRYSL